MSWKTSLDRYLTEPFDDGFDGWYETMTEFLTETFFNANEDWCLAYDGVFNKWAKKCFTIRANLQKRLQL